MALVKDEGRYFIVFEININDYKGDELKDLYTRHDNWCTLTFHDKEWLLL